MISLLPSKHQQFSLVVTLNIKTANIGRNTCHFVERKKNVRELLISTKKTNGSFAWLQIKTSNVIPTIFK